MASAKPEAQRSSTSNESADSYIGSLITLTSKSEIRYEGLFCDINCEDSTIGLTNVRSFGTEGRKQDGPQVGPSDKVYEYILFRGSDIKNLRVISQAATTTTPVFTDPAIIQNHHSASDQPPSNGLAPDPSAQNPQSGGLPGPTFQSNLHLYQPTESNPSPWAQSPSLPTTYGAASPMMYYPGYYGLPNGSQAQQQPLVTPTLGFPMSAQSPAALQQSLLTQTPPPSHGWSVPSSSAQQQQTQFPQSHSHSLFLPKPNFKLPLDTSAQTPSLMQQTAHNSSAPDLGHRYKSLSESPSGCLPIPNFQYPNFPPQPTSLSLDTSNFQSAVLPAQPSSVISESLLNNPLLSSLNKPVLASDSNVPAKTSEPSYISVASNLITPGQLLQPGTSSAGQTHLNISQEDNGAAEASVLNLPHPPQALPQSSGLLSSHAQEPLLPLPSPAEYRPHAAHGHPFPRHNNRGFHRGRGNAMSRPVTRFTEEFDFTAMNEKFNKDEVWGDIGKSRRDQEDVNEPEEENDVGSTKPESNPVYVKDDFFDSLSNNAQRRDSLNGRFNFSHQRKLDTETFGFVPRHNRGGRGGYWQGRGGYGQGRGGYGQGQGGRSGGGYYGRGGNGQFGRGRDHDSPGPGRGT